MARAVIEWIGRPMDLCVLPQTGTSEQWLVLVAVAIIVIGAGIALALSGKARRRVATGLGALAIVGALALGSVGAAAPALADAGSASCVTAPAGTRAPAAATLVTPGIPTAAAQCLAEPAITTPTTAGVTYTQVRDGATLTLTAAAQPGFAITPGATTVFTFDMTPGARAPWPVALPERIATTVGETSEPEDGQIGGYLIPDDAALVPALQAAAEAGTLTYALDASQFRQFITLVVLDGETGVELGRQTFGLAQPSTLTYDFERGEYLLLLSAEPSEEDFAEVQAQIDAFLAQFPEDSEDFQAEFGFDGLQLSASYVPGAACGLETVVVPIDLGLPVVGDGPGEVPAPRGLTLDALVDAAATDDADASAATAEATPTVVPAESAGPVVDPSVETPEQVAPTAPTEAPDSEVPAPVEG